MNEKLPSKTLRIKNGNHYVFTGKIFLKKCQTLSPSQSIQFQSYCNAILSKPDERGAPKSCKLKVGILFFLRTEYFKSSYPLFAKFSDFF